MGPEYGYAKIDREMLAAAQQNAPNPYATTEPSEVQSLEMVERAMRVLLDRIDTAAGHAHGMRMRVEGDGPETAQPQRASQVRVGGRLGEILVTVERIGDRLDDLDRNLSGLSARL